MPHRDRPTHARPAEQRLAPLRRTGATSVEAPVHGRDVKRERVQSSQPANAAPVQRSVQDAGFVTVARGGCRARGGTPPARGGTLRARPRSQQPTPVPGGGTAASWIVAVAARRPPRRGDVRPSGGPWCSLGTLLRDGGRPRAVRPVNGGVGVRVARARSGTSRWAVDGMAKCAPRRGGRTGGVRPDTRD